LEKLFEADVKRIPYKESRPWILLSPLDSREKVTQLIQDAKRSIRFFSASLSDSEILNLLEQKARWGVTVEICLTEAKNSERTRLIERFKPLWIFVKQAKKPYVHAKSLLIDDSILLIWSMNFTQNSIDNNREVGLILNKSAFLPEYRQIVSRDCSG
jgi:phosphatidylserine/phosphatidylglycerophosphate/cardiolipin synthase-like enzyme